MIDYDKDKESVRDESVGIYKELNSTSTGTHSFDIFDT